MVDESARINNPLIFIQECVRGGRILWTHHVNMRMKDRSISREMILGSVDHFEIIETNPEDKYFPSCLVLSQFENRPFHALFALDMVGNNVRIVTTYFPGPEQWEADFKTRRK